MSSIYHHKHAHATQRPERSRTDQPRQHRSAQGGKSPDKRRAIDMLEKRDNSDLLVEHGEYNPDEFFK